MSTLRSLARARLFQKRHPADLPAPSGEIGAMRGGIFISHDTVEQPAAEVVSQTLAGFGLECFVAGSNIRLGDAWEKKIATALTSCDTLLVLCSARSLDSSWVWMELGAAVASGRRVVPVILPGLDADRLPDTISHRQHVALDSPQGCQKLVAEFGKSFADGGTGMYDRLVEVLDWRKTRPGVPLPVVNGPRFLMDVSHNQLDWPRGLTGPHAFNGFGLAATSIERDGALSLDAPQGIGAVAAVPVGSTDQLYRGHLSDWTGLVVAAPWRTSIEREVIDEIEAWVHRGGKLLLLGYEFGDRHHGGNLNDLAGRFGLRFRTDIVAPAETPMSGAIPHATISKPYGTPVTLPVAVGVDHPLIAGLDNVELVNVQSIDVEPGGRVLVALGANLIAEPDPVDVRYVSGRFIGLRDRCVVRGAQEWLGALTVAPQGLTGTGEVVAMGTWQLGRGAIFADNLVGWLTADRAGPVHRSCDHRGQPTNGPR